MPQHRLLQRQLRKCFGRDFEIPEEMKAFVESVDQAYQQFDDDRKLTERAMSLSSDELTEKNDQLKELVLVKESAEQSMRNARDMAEEASRHKSDFLANMSHEIRTPLNAIIGMSNLLFNLELTERQREYVDIVLNSGESLLGVINDILDFSKIEAGELEIDRHSFDLTNLLEKVIDVFGFQCYQKEIDILLYIDPNAPLFVEGDSIRLRQVLINLIGNAIKFTEKGGVMVSLKCERLGDNWQLQLVVEDTGIGMPTDRLEHIFDSFTQVDASTSRKFGGTGLGLAICRRLVELMGGVVNVESVVGKGSRFEFGVVCYQSKENEAASVAFNSALVALKGKSVQLAVESQLLQRAIERQLRSWKMLPVSILSRSGIVEAAESADAVVWDESLASQNESAARYLLNAKKESDRSIIAIKSLNSEYDNEIDVFSEAISKPLKPSDLLDALNCVFHGENKPSVEKKKQKENVRIAEACPLKILIAEDNKTNQKILKLILNRFGYSEITAVFNGKKALEELNREEYDIVIIDLQMPEMDGLEATRELRRTIPIEMPPYILALTANASTTDSEACYEAGMHGYLSKPVRQDDLRDEIVKAYEWLQATGVEKS